jgi:hypothetical protein
MNRTLLLLALLIALAPSAGWSADPPAQSDIPTPKFERQVIDAKIQIGYGLAIGDVDGDGKPDILLADKKQIVWYRNPDWKRFVMAEDLTPQDNVCIAARDIDGSGKVSVAVGAGWNPSETTDPTKSGGVFYLIRPEDPTQHWEPVRLHHEVTTHRMQWVRSSKDMFHLVVVPLHGLGNKDGNGAGVRVLAYDIPKDPHGTWTTHVIEDSMHLTHNFELWWNQHAETEHVFIAGREGIGAIVFGFTAGGWRNLKGAPILSNQDMKSGAGEVRFCYLPDTFGFATIEPMHGNQVVYYPGYQGSEKFARVLVDDTLAEGHALACADLLGVHKTGRYSHQHQIVAGWRAPNKEKKVGIKLYVPLDDKGEKWQTHVIDDNQMACEDLKIADLDGDGQPDIIAAGRATHNLVIYWNRTRTR